MQPQSLISIFFPKRSFKNWFYEKNTFYFNIHLEPQIIRKPPNAKNQRPRHCRFLQPFPPPPSLPLSLSLHLFISLDKSKAKNSNKAKEKSLERVRHSRIGCSALKLYGKCEKNEQNKIEKNANKTELIEMFNWL